MVRQEMICRVVSLANGGVMAISDLGRYVRRRARCLNMNIAEVARRAGLSRSGLYKILNGEIRHVRLETLQGLSRALKVEYLELVQILTTEEAGAEAGEDPARAGKPGLARPLFGWNTSVGTQGNA